MSMRRVQKLTVELQDEALYKAVKHASVDFGMPAREIVAQALRDWLEQKENEEDLRAMAEAEDDEVTPHPLRRPRRPPGVSRLPRAPLPRRLP